MSSPRVPVLQSPSETGRTPEPQPRWRWPVFLLVALLVAAGVVVVAVVAGSNDTAPDPGPIDAEPPVAGLPQPVADTAAEIAAAAQDSDWERLAALALAGDATFTASFGEDFATVEALAAYWRGLATEEDLPRLAAGHHRGRRLAVLRPG